MLCPGPAILGRSPEKRKPESDRSRRCSVPRADPRLRPAARPGAHVGVPAQHLPLLGDRPQLDDPAEGDVDPRRDVGDRVAAAGGGDEALFREQVAEESERRLADTQVEERRLVLDFLEITAARTSSSGFLSRVAQSSIGSHFACGNCAEPTHAYNAAMRQLETVE